MLLLLVHSFYRRLSFNSEHICKDPLICQLEGLCIPILPPLSSYFLSPSLSLSPPPPLLLSMFILPPYMFVCLSVCSWFRVSMLIFWKSLVIAILMTSNDATIFIHHKTTIVKKTPLQKIYCSIRCILCAISRMHATTISLHNSSSITSP